MKPPCVLRNIPKNPLFYKVLIMTSFQYDVTGEIIYIWALPLVPAVTNVRKWYPLLILPIDSPPIMQGLFVPFAHVGSSDPIRVLCLSHNEHTGYHLSIYC